MKNLMLVFFLLIINQILFAQEYCAKIVYNCKTSIRKGKVHDGKNTLYFDTEKSLFVHNDFPTEDSYIDKGTIVHYIKGDTEGLPVFIHLKDAYLYYKSEYRARPGEIFIFREDLPVINWTIGTQTKKIGDFDCIRAVGIFGGRTYDAWFTPEIPVGLGPYKLCGLPGMILEAASRDGKVAYDFVAYEAPCDKKIEKPSQGRELTWQEYETLVINQLLRSEARCPPNVICTENDPPEDYEIERSKFTILSTYKANRKNKK